MARIARWNLGQTIQGRDLTAVAFAPEGEMAPSTPEKAKWPWFLLIAGVHGDEVEGIWAVDQIMQGLMQDHPYEKLGVIVLQEANPDGTALGQRYNANGIDLNRNLPSKDWTSEVKNPRYPPGPHAASEPETKSLVNLLKAVQPVAIMSVHSFSKPQVNANGPSLEWAKGVAAVCGYEVTTDIGYPTPGCLGTYTGAEQGIPTITLEILRGMEEESVRALFTMTIATAISYWDNHET